MKLSVFFRFSCMGWSNILDSRLKEGPRNNCYTKIPGEQKNVYKNYELKWQHGICQL